MKLFWNIKDDLDYAVVSATLQENGEHIECKRLWMIRPLSENHGKQIAIEAIRKKFPFAEILTITIDPA